MTQSQIGVIVPIFNEESNILNLLNNIKVHIKLKKKGLLNL